jgi:hypothetical protein
MPPYLQLLINGGKQILPQAAIGAGLGAVEALYDVNNMPGSKRDPRFPNVPSPAEDFKNYAFLGANVVPFGRLSTGMKTITGGFTALNPLLQELFSKEKQGLRYDKNKYYADEYAKSLKDKAQGDEDWDTLSKLTENKQKAVIQLITAMRARGASLDQIKEVIKTKPSTRTPGDVLRGNIHWDGQFPSGFRSDSIINNNKMLVRGPNQ